MKNIKKIGLVGLGLVGLGSFANAAVTLPTALDVTPIESLAGLILGALATIWVVRKVISFMGR